MPIKKGFLLVDLMVAITIFFLAASLTINLGFAVKKMHCIMELFLLKQTIQITQLQAMTTGIDQTISIDIKNNAYTSPHTKTIFKSISIASKIVDILPLNGQKNAPVSCSFARDKITCFKSGIISAGTLYFYANDDKSLFFCLSCPVSQSNNINIYEYKNEWSIYS